MNKLPLLRNAVYSLRDVLQRLELPDAPHLMFDFGGKQRVIQNSHVTYADLLSIPQFAGSNWRYLRTTSELIPLFKFVDVADDITLYVDMEPWLNDDGTESEDLWVTPKGFKREQYNAHLRRTTNRKEG